MMPLRDPLIRYQLIKANMFFIPITRYSNTWACLQCYCFNYTLPGTNRQTRLINKHYARIMAKKSDTINGPLFLSLIFMGK